MRRIAVYPGSFDPITNGHVDIVERASKLFDHVHIIIANNMDKNSFFTPEEKVEMVSKSTSHIGNVTVAIFDGFIYQYAISVGAQFLIRGLRTLTDFQYENQLFDFNYTNSEKKLDTVCLFSHSPHTFLSSSLVKDTARLKGDISRYVPNVLLILLIKK